MGSVFVFGHRCDKNHATCEYRILGVIEFGGTEF